MRDSETLRQGHQAYALALAPRLIERLDWPADRLALHRAQRLRDLVREAIGRSPWHRERLAGVDVTRLDDDGLCELPPMTKADLMDNFDRIATDERLSLGAVNDHLETVTTGSYLLDRYTAVTSGGVDRTPRSLRLRLGGMDDVLDGLLPPNAAGQVVRP